MYFMWSVKNFGYCIQLRTEWITNENEIEYEKQKQVKWSSANSSVFFNII